LLLPSRPNRLGPVRRGALWALALLDSLIFLLPFPVAFKRIPAARPTSQISCRYGKFNCRVSALRTAFICSTPLLLVVHPVFAFSNQSAHEMRNVSHNVIREALILIQGHCQLCEGSL